MTTPNEDARSIRRRAQILALEDERLHADLIRLREEQGLTQQQVADLLGVTQPTIAAFERYDNDPRLSTVRRYALAIGALVEHTVTRDDGNRQADSEFRPAVAVAHFGVVNVGGNFSARRRVSGEFVPAA